MSDSDELLNEIEGLKKQNAALVNLKRKNAAKRKRSTIEMKADKKKIHRLNKQLQDKDNRLKTQSELLDTLKQRNEKIAALQMQNAVNFSPSKQKKIKNHRHQMEIERKCRLNKEIEEKDQLHERVNTAQSFHSVIHELKKHPNTLKKGNIVITIKKECSIQMIGYLNKLVKKVCANKGFDQGIWQKRQLRSHGDTVVFIFNYFEKDVMSCPGVRELVMMLSQIDDVEVKEIA